MNTLTYDNGDGDRLLGLGDLAHLQRHAEIHAELHHGTPLSWDDYGYSLGRAPMYADIDPDARAYVARYTIQRTA